MSFLNRQQYNVMTTTNNIPHSYKESALGIIPSDWEVKRLGEVCNGKGIYGINAPAVKYEDRLPTYLRITDINEFGYFSRENLASVEDESSHEYMLKDGDIVFARTGATVGKTYLYNPNDGALVYAGFLIKFSPKKEIVLPYFIKANTETSRYWAWVRVVSQRSGQPGINAVEYGTFRFPLPPLSEQKKIAEVLGVWDMAIEKQTRLIEQLEWRKKGLMQQLLTGKKRLPGFSEKWKFHEYGKLLKEMKRKMTWNDDELYDLISVKRRSAGLFKRESLYGRDIKTKNLRPACNGDFLISKMQIVHGASGLTTDEFDGMKISGSYIALIARDSKELDIQYFTYWSQMPFFYHQCYISSYGVHIEKMTFDIDIFMSLGMNIPSLAEQKEIVKILDITNRYIEDNRQKLEQLRTQKRGLMQQLLTGKKRVTLNY